MNTTKPMRVQSVFYNNPDYYPPMINAAFVLAQHGIRQQLLCREYQPAVMPQGDIDYPAATQVLRLPQAGGGTLAAYLNFIWNVLRQSDPAAEIIIGYDMHGFLPARLLAWLRRRPLVYHCHDYLNNASAATLSQRIIKTFERRFARTADLVIAPDEYLASYMAQELRLSRFPLVAANAPLTTVERSGSKLTAALDALGKHFTRILFRQGRVGPNHGIEVTLRSLPLWARQDWGFVVMGPGSADFVDTLWSLAEQLGVADRFAILPPVDYPAVASFTIAADLGHALYEPAIFEHQFSTTGSNKIMEYMAAGLPLLLSDTPGNRKLLDECRNGLIADVAAPESIAEAVNTILGDDQLARQMGANSRNAFETTYNYAQQYAPVIAQLRQLTTARHQRRPAKSSGE